MGCTHSRVSEWLHGAYWLAVINRAVFWLSLPGVRADAWTPYWLSSIESNRGLTHNNNVVKSANITRTSPRSARTVVDTGAPV
jgi:hypothetical protein